MEDLAKEVVSLAANLPIPVLAQKLNDDKENVRHSVVPASAASEEEEKEKGGAVTPPRKEKKREEEGEEGSPEKLATQVSPYQAIPATGKIVRNLARAEPVVAFTCSERRKEAISKIIKEYAALLRQRTETHMGYPYNLDFQFGELVSQWRCTSIHAA
jgi:hypothetical protein